MERMCFIIIVCAHKIRVCVFHLVPLEQESHLRLWSTGPFSPALAHLPRLPVLIHPGLCAALAAPVEKYPRVPHITMLCHSVLLFTLLRSTVNPGQAMDRHSWSSPLLCCPELLIDSHAYAQREAVVWLLV